MSGHTAMPKSDARRAMTFPCDRCDTQTANPENKYGENICDSCEQKAAVAGTSKYKATRCDDGEWMVHTDGDVLAYAAQGNSEQKAKTICDVLNSHADLVKALEECAAPYSTMPGSVQECAAQVHHEFQRRLNIASAALATLTARKVG